jgi:ribonuclease T1
VFPTGLASSGGVLGSEISSCLSGVAGDQTRKRWARGGVALAVAVSTWIAAAVGVSAGLSSAAYARETREDAAAATVSLSRLPPQAQETHRLILNGGPFPYTKDGTVFGNRERLLPRKNRGYYHEYTVKTPGSRDRGARRIVCGGKPKTQPEACYYTADHYATFSRIEP